MTPAETLRRARALIERPEAWTKGTSARWHRQPVDVESPLATCWCAFGAIRRQSVDRATQDRAIGRLRRFSGPNVVDWNDAPERTHAEVIEAFDRAIEKAEAEETAR